MAKIQIRRDTAANWTSADPTLSSGEIGFETDTGQIKIGDGATAWTSLAYFAVSGAGDMLAATYDPATISEQLVGLTATQTLTNKTLTSPVINTGVSGTAILDDDTFATATNTTLATSESIKAYVDSSSGGDVVGPAVVVDEDIAVFDGTTGKLIKKLAGVTSAAVIANTAKLTADATNVNAAGAVMEADFNANTILYATTDDTPVALTVAEQTLVGRITSGAIDSLTVTEVKTLLIDRLEEDATVTGTKNIDWSAYETFRYTLTAACVFSDTNLPATGSKTITLYLSGNFAPTYPAGWTTHIDGTYTSPAGEINTIVAEYVKAGTPFWKVSIIQED